MNPVTQVVCAIHKKKVDKANRVILGIIAGYEKKYSTDQYLCTWYTLELHAPRHPQWPGFDAGPPRAALKRAVVAGWVKITTLPSPGRSFDSEHYTLTAVGQAELQRLKELFDE